LYVPGTGSPSLSWIKGLVDEFVIAMGSVYLEQIASLHEKVWFACDTVNAYYYHCLIIIVTQGPRSWGGGWTS